jgi:hypothetical protein
VFFVQYYDSIGGDDGAKGGAMENGIVICLEKGVDDVEVIELGWL